MQQHNVRLAPGAGFYHSLTIYCIICYAAPNYIVCSNLPNQQIRLVAQNVPFNSGNVFTQILQYAATVDHLDPCGGIQSRQLPLHYVWKGCPGAESSESPVVDDDPSATIVSVPPARSFAFVDTRGAPSDNPFLNPRQAAAGLKGPPWSCASVAVLKIPISGASRSRHGRWRILDVDLDPSGNLNRRDLLISSRATQRRCLRDCQKSRRDLRPHNRGSNPYVSAARSPPASPLPG